MLSRILISVACALMVAPAFAEDLKLRPLKPIVVQFSQATEPDISELAYITARGAALFTALSGYITENPGKERDKKIAEELQKRAVPYYQVATACGLMTKKSSEKTNEQIKLLLSTYAKMIVQSKQLNNEILSPAILEDLESLKEIEPSVIEFAATIEKENRANKKP